MAMLLKVFLISNVLVAAATKGKVGDPLGMTGALPLSASTHAATLINSASMPTLSDGGSAMKKSGVTLSANARASVAPLPVKRQRTEEGQSTAEIGESVQPSLSAPPLQLASGQQALDIGATANLLNLPSVDAGLPDISSIGGGLQGLGLPSVDSNLGNLVAPQPLEDRSPVTNRISMMRREPMQRGDSLSREIASDSSSRTHLSLDETDGAQDGHHHKFPFQDNPRFTPEAIFADHRLAPDVAEFLGHLAQRSRVHRKEYVKSANEAGLVQGQGRMTTYDEGEDDDRDDIEDMKKQAASGPKTTALSSFFETLDAKTTTSSWSPAECAAIAKNVTAKYLRLKGKSHASWATSGPAGDVRRSEVHTGMFFRHWKIGTVKQAARKIRLGVLSFLATQDPARVKLHIWTDLDNHNSSLREILGPIAYHPELMDAINITKFDPNVEFSNVPPTLAKETLKERFKKDELPNMRPDLIRSVILYNYGGMWMDADTVLLQDVAPLLGEDWAYLVRGKQGAVEGALLSVSRPASHFASEYLISYVMREPPLELDAKKEKPLLVELFSNDPSHTSLHVLPPCFMDSDVEPLEEIAVLAANTMQESNFFSKAVTEPYRAHFSIGIRDAIHDNSTAEVSVLQDPAFLPYVSSEQEKDEDDDKPPPPSSPSFAYHFRGNFGAPWAKGSLADVAERTFMKKLNIHARR